MGRTTLAMYRKFTSRGVLVDIITNQKEAFINSLSVPLAAAATTPTHHHTNEEREGLE